MSAQAHADKERSGLANAEQSLADIAPQFDNEKLPEARTVNPWIIAMVVTLGTFMEVLDTSIANVALPHIAGSLSASQDEGAWVLTSYLVANAIVLPISGWVSSIMGRRNFYLTSVCFFTIFSAACGLAPSLGLLILFRVLQGLAGGGLQPSVQAILADTFSQEKRGMAMALYTIAILCAPVLGPTLGGWITDNYSWRWIFYINIPVGAVCIFLTRIVLEDPPHMKEKMAQARKIAIDWTGLGLIALGLATLEIVLDKGQELDWFGSNFIVTFTIIAAVSLVTLVFWELRTANPVVNLRLLKERNFLFCCLLILGLYSVLYATTYLLPVFMQEMMGYDATTAGFALSPAGLVAMAEIPFVGYLLTKGRDPRKMIFIGMAIIASSCWWMSTLNLDVAEISLVLPRVVQVLGVGLITVPISTIMFSFLPKSESSQASGIYALVRNEGGSLGIALASTMLQRRAQMFQHYLVRNTTGTSGIMRQYLVRLGGGPHANPDQQHAAIAMLYGLVQRQAMLLSYMAQFRMLSVMLVAMIPLIFFLKRPQRRKHVELEAH